MNFSHFKYYLIAFVLINGLKMFSQDINTKITVVSPYEPSISDATKINIMPVFSDTSNIRPEFNYTIHSEKLNIDFLPRPINPAKMVTEPQGNLYNSYVKLGLGNYLTPLAEINICSLRSKNYSIGFYGNHQSSYSNINLDNNIKMFGGYDDNVMHLFGKRIFKSFTLNGDAELKQNTVYYYGFNTDTSHIPYNQNNTRQDFLNLEARINLESNFPYDSTKLYYLININDEYITDKFLTGQYNKNYENGWHVNGMLKKNISGFYAGLLAGVDNFNRSTTFDSMTTNTIITINPFIKRSGTDWKFNLGVKAIVDQTSNNSTIYWYPDIQFEFTAIEDVLRAYFGLDGTLKVNNYQTIVNENPFIIPNLYVRNSNQKMNLFGGLKGSLSSAIEFNLSVAYAKVDNMYFFVNDTVNKYFFQTSKTYRAGNQFNVVYDDIDWIHYLAEINLKASSSLSITGKLDVNDYKTFLQAYAWELPSIKASLSPILIYVIKY